MEGTAETPCCLLYVSLATHPRTLSTVMPRGPFKGGQGPEILPCLRGWWAARRPSLLPPEALLAWCPGAGAGAREQPVGLLAVLLFLVKRFIPQEVPIIPGAHCTVCGLIPDLHAQAGLEGEGQAVSKGRATTRTIRHTPCDVYSVLSPPSLTGGRHNAWRASPHLLLRR